MSFLELLMLCSHQVITIPRIHKYYFPRNARLGKKVPKIGGSRNPGNFPIFITPKKFTSFYSKDFLPKLIFLRKGVHHPKFRIFGGPRKKSGFPEIPEISKSVFSSFWSKFLYFLLNLKLLDLRSNFWQY